MLLDDHRVDPSVVDDDEVDALVWACRWGHVEIVRLLLMHPMVDPSRHGCKCYLEAFKHGYDEIVSLLLKDGRIDTSQLPKLIYLDLFSNG